MKKRYLTRHIIPDLEEKMVFVGRARQVGKTSLSRFIGEIHFSPCEYLNWDFALDRKSILEYRFKSDAKILLFDEIHKYKS